MNTAASAETIRPPSPFLALTEVPRALFEFSTLPVASLLTRSAPRGDGHPVLVLPGFVTTDLSTGPLRRYLASMGHDVHAWELGRNLGPKAIGREGEKLIARLEHIYEKSGQKVSLVGWSLGGILARQLSRRRPGMVRQVISLGSPFVGDPRASNVWQAYEFLTGQRIKDPDTRAQMRESEEVPPVPSTAIYTKADGIVAWQNCREPASAHTDNVEVPGSHCGLGVNGLVHYAVADRLAQPEGSWKPFAPSGWSALLYPKDRVH
jgi:pimeloyl-ACP methyl ester carboxylesterase